MMKHFVDLLEDQGAEGKMLEDEEKVGLGVERWRSTGLADGGWRSRKFFVCCWSMEE